MCQLLKSLEVKYVLLTVVGAASQCTESNLGVQGGFFMDEDYSGLPFEESPIQERPSVKLFTMSQEDITSRRSHDLIKGTSLHQCIDMNRPLLLNIVAMPKSLTAVSC